MPKFLDQKKQQATTLMNELPLPRADKTNIKTFGYENIEVKQSDTTLGLPEEVSHLVEESETQVIVIKDGMIVYQNVEGVEVYDLETVSSQEDVFAPHFMNVADVSEHYLTAQHVAHLNSGLFIHVPRNTVVADAINIVYVQQSGSFMHHTLVVADTSSSVKIIENYVTNEPALVNVMTEVVVKDNAQVEHASLDHFDKTATVYSKKAASVLNHGRYLLSLGALNAGNVVYETNVNLNGEGAFSEVKTVGISDDVQKQNLTIAIEHFAPYTEGYIVNHGVSKDEGQLVFNGIGKINKGMHHSVAKQETRSMILSERAVAAANPILLIDEYDVSAGHAAGVGKIDEEQLYYLMSRGLSRQQAEILIIYGFLMPFVEDIKNEKLQALFTTIIEQKINL